MRRVFLSYAKEDSAAAKQLVIWLKDQGVENVYWFQDPEVRGERIRANLEKELAAADSFFVLMSEHYLKSRWCQREWDVVIGREDMKVKVFRVGPAEPKEAGFLGTYDWLDLDFAKMPASLDPLLADEGGEPPPFKNRDDELALVGTALSTTGGQDLWVIVAPPRMGKSWFLERLKTQVEGTWQQVKVLDLRYEPSDLRIDPGKLLAALLDVNIPAGKGTSSQAVQLDIARQVRKRNKSQLYVLDSADMLDQECATQVRSALAVVRESMGSAANSGRFGAVIGTRRHKEWRGIANGRFSPVVLSEFSVDTVARSIAAYGRIRDEGETEECAILLHGMSEGLPAMLAGWLTWAKDKDFYRLTESECSRHFCEVVKPYAEDDLLTAHSLVPLGGEGLAERTRLIRLTLRALVVYRYFTKSHLRFQLETNEEIRALADNMGWTDLRLWEEVCRTSLIQQSSELWQCISPPIRRLLYRYHYDSVDEGGRDEDKARVHGEAQRFYRGWIEKEAGGEQPRVMLECLWHETSRLLADQPEILPGTLPDLAAQLTREFITSEMYGREEIASFVEVTLNQDAEFHTAIKDYDGLFDQVLESIVSALAEGRS